MAGDQLFGRDIVGDAPNSDMTLRYSVKSTLVADIARNTRLYRTSTFLNCQGSLASISSGNNPGRSVSGVQSV